MKVLQIIDSLNPGGAEQMAVNYANLLQEKGIESYLCCTREEGLLKKNLNEEVNYFFLNKTSALDLKATIRLKKFIDSHQIDLIHAHGTSFFTATIQKLLNKKLKLVWHEHNGKRIFQTKKDNATLVICSKVFDAVVTVNLELTYWAKRNLAVFKVFYVPNFVKSKDFSVAKIRRGKEIQLVCLANLREPKNHLNLLKAFSQVHEKSHNVKLHLIGKDFQDEYSKQLKDFLKQKTFQDKVIFHDSIFNVAEVLSTMDIGILSSDSEGLPLALLEYGKAKLPVISTDVGQSAEVLSGYGKLVEPKNTSALAEAINYYILNAELREQDADNFQTIVENNFSEKAVLPIILKIYKELLQSRN